MPPIDRNQLPEISATIKRHWQPRRQDFSAGGVAYRVLPRDPQADGAHMDPPVPPPVEVALIATHGTRRWQLPKGTCERGETVLETALREVAEEAGLVTEPVTFLRRVEYWYWDTYRKEVAHLVQKRVDFYLLRMIGGELSDASYEVDAVAWFTPAQALRAMTFAAERAVLRAAMEHLGVSLATHIEP